MTKTESLRSTVVLVLFSFQAFHLNNNNKNDNGNNNNNDNDNNNNNHTVKPSTLTGLLLTYALLKYPVSEVILVQ